VAGLAGLLQGEQSSHQRGAQLTAGLGVEQPRSGRHIVDDETDDERATRASRQHPVIGQSRGWPAREWQSLQTRERRPYRARLDVGAAASADPW
jgi:hypothetical protein